MRILIICIGKIWTSNQNEDNLIYYSFHSGPVVVILDLSFATKISVTSVFKLFRRVRPYVMSG